MRLVLFVPQLCSGGAQQVAVLLSSAFAARGHDVVIALATMTGELVGHVDNRCRLWDLRASRPIKATRQLADLVNETQPDAVICFGIYTGIAAALSKLRWHKPTSLIIRNENNLRTDWQQGTPVNRIIGPFLSRWVARHSHIIAVSHALAKPTAEFLRIPFSQVTTILNPVIDDASPLISTDNEAIHPWLKDKSSPTFVAMGRLEYQKGFDLLIAAFARVHQQVAARLVIFGEGSLHETLRAQIAASGLEDAVALAGYTSMPMAQMKAAHAFVLSSRFEGFGLVLVEALRAGTQVIATDCDYGPAELLENGRYGVLVPTENPQALAEAMLASLTQPRATSRPNAAWFKQFTASEAARQHLALIESIHRSAKV